MSEAPGGASRQERGRSRPRFRAGLPAALAALSLLAGCAGYGLGFADLPASAGWQRLPLNRWLMNPGLGPARIVYCPRRECARPAVVATLAANGEEGAMLWRSLADPRALLRPQAPEAGTLAARARKHGRPAPRKSDEQASPFKLDGLDGYRVTLSPRVPGGHPAYAVVLARRQADRVQVALAVTTDPEAALQEAKAAAKSF